MIKESLIGLILQAIDRTAITGSLPPLEAAPVVELSVPKSKDHGDYASNIALILAKPLKMSPRSVAQVLVAEISAIEADSSVGIIENVEIAGPGFINFKLRPGWLPAVLQRIESEGAEYGRSKIGAGQRIQVEFVSANPNGPITVAHGRGGAVGDGVASLLQAIGYEVQREFYINDALNSTQMNNFGRSVWYRYVEAVTGSAPIIEGDGPEYGGEYVSEIARAIAARVGDRYVGADINDSQTIQTFRSLSEEGMLEEQKSDLEAFGIRFDNWVRESTLHDSGAVAAAIKELTDRGHTYSEDGALWFRTTTFGDDKDRVLLRKDGSPTYMAGDVAYHREKMHRNFDRLIDIWGADHAGYVSRMKASMQALGYEADKLQILLFQLVRILKDGEFVRSSKRKGNVLELRADLIDEIGIDAARFYFLMRSSDASLDIDIDLARDQSSKNPVYYVQYAHARCCNVFQRAVEDGKTTSSDVEVDLTLLTQNNETELVKKLREYPDEVAYAARQYSPHHLTHYIRDLAGMFHTFYDSGNNESSLRVLCDDPALRAARLELTGAVRTVLANALGILGISAPEKM